MSERLMFCGLLTKDSNKHVPGMGLLRLQTSSDPGTIRGLKAPEARRL